MIGTEPSGKQQHPSSGRFGVFGFRRRRHRRRRFAVFAVLDRLAVVQFDAVEAERVDARAVGHAARFEVLARVAVRHRTGPHEAEHLAVVFRCALHPVITEAARAFGVVRIVHRRQQNAAFAVRGRRLARQCHRRNHQNHQQSNHIRC